MEFDPKQDKRYVQPMERDIQARLNETRASMMNYEKGSDEYNRLSDHATEFRNALTEIASLRADQDNLYRINFGGMEFSKEAGGEYFDASGSLTYGGVNEEGKNVININIQGKYAGTTGIMLHEFKHAEQFRIGDLGFYVNANGEQVDSSNNQEMEKQANYRGDVYSFKNTGTSGNYQLSGGYSSIPPHKENTMQYNKIASKNGQKYVTGKQKD
jgi:hypothetical protein